MCGLSARRQTPADISRNGLYRFERILGKKISTLNTEEMRNGDGRYQTRYDTINELI